MTSAGDPTPTCPTCGAAYRGRATCGRCGTDLRRLTAVLRQAHALREEARACLLDERPEAALDLLAASRRLHDTPRSRRLRVLALLGQDRLREAVRLAAPLLEP